MERYTHVQSVCGGSEPEYTSGRKDFILGPRLGEGDNKLLVLFKGEQKIFIAACGEQMLFQHMFPNSGAPPPGGII